jgi:DNA-binding response OmpR family regulator
MGNLILNRYILIADDNEGIVDILKSYVNKEGFTAITASDGEEALLMFKQYSPALILLDVMMPKKDGFEICREIRRSSNVPIIMVTARSEDADRIMGLDIGADDYVIKPFSPSEVMARIRAVLRRIDLPEKDQKDILRYPELEINIADYEVKVHGKLLNLTKKETEILWLLASNPGKVFTRDNLLSSIWGYDYFGDARTVDTHIKRLRAKIDLPVSSEWEIKTIWGVGYKFEVKHV